MNDKYILAIDQGTTSCRALLINENGNIVNIAQKEFTQFFPQAGWVEHDANEIWQVQWQMIVNVIRNSGVNVSDIVAAGITNQRETTVVWDKATGEPIHHAIVWQDRRTSAICDQLKNNGLTDEFHKKTGLFLDAYFSGTKVKWILDNIPGARNKAVKGELLFGTIDSWLIWKLTRSQVHMTDYTNASRTLMFNIQNLEWDSELLEVLEVPESMLPKAQGSIGDYGSFELDGQKIPILGVAGDQQAALFGQACFDKGTAKNTYGTGCFMLLNVGGNMQLSNSGLLTTLAATMEGQKPQYALEGSVFIAGAAIQWLRDGLKILDDAADSSFFAEKVKENDVVVIPAFAGLGAPYWDMYARGAIFGLTRGTTRSHIVKATLQSLAFQTKDVLEAMAKDSGMDLLALKVDGGATANDYLMQFQADILDVPVEKPAIIESTAMGAAYMAGIKVGIWDQNSIQAQIEIDKVYTPDMDGRERKKLYSQWLKAIDRVRDWEK